MRRKGVMMQAMTGYPFQAIAYNVADVFQAMLMGRKVLIDGTDQRMGHFGQPTAIARESGGAPCTSWLVTFTDGRQVHVSWRQS